MAQKEHKHQTKIPSATIPAVARHLPYKRSSETHTWLSVWLFTI